MIDRETTGREQNGLVITLWLDFYLGFSCTTNSTFVTPAGVMADMSQTEKVQLHAPHLEELRGGKD